jgi:hypothetical protein
MFNSAVGRHRPDFVKMSMAHMRLSGCVLAFHPVGKTRYYKNELLLILKTTWTESVSL